MELLTLIRVISGNIFKGGGVAMITLIFTFILLISFHAFLFSEEVWQEVVSLGMVCISLLVIFLAFLIN